MSFKYFHELSLVKSRTATTTKNKHRIKQFIGTESRKTKIFVGMDTREPSLKIKYFYVVEEKIIIKRGQHTTKRDERAGGSVGGKSEWADGMEIAFLSVFAGHKG